MAAREIVCMGIILVMLIILTALSELPRRRRYRVWVMKVKPDLNGHRWMIVGNEFIDIDEEEERQGNER